MQEVGIDLLDFLPVVAHSALEESIITLEEEED
jgi:hypothetical protein